jgi:hypothetical protein
LADTFIMARRSVSIASLVWFCRASSHESITWTGVSSHTMTHVVSPPSSCAKISGDKAGGKAGSERRRKTVAPKRRNAPKSAGRRNSLAAGKETNEFGIRGSESRSRLTLRNAKKFARTSDVSN